eukprot:CAMPEP_0206455260 /NCGR_PEP_ID=MMETSP0324_2-20121206/21647_1 /ASSEMBLY_ACC=CAM_ASM_000836 /TAXON_ID=2866 /ORGANISM="Crypthecodinium cohnii, Strain Seligo" /LENGTH=223 /DNA_ID=CAMNT_0053925931 /DNA_START=592 /DNA_END=1264 /DNA_ORIENTATION=-
MAARPVESMLAPALDHWSTLFAAKGLQADGTDFTVQVAIEKHRSESLCQVPATTRPDKREGDVQSDVMGPLKHSVTRPRNIQGKLLLGTASTMPIPVTPHPAERWHQNDNVLVLSSLHKSRRQPEIDGGAFRFHSFASGHHRRATYPIESAVLQPKIPACSAIQPSNPRQASLRLPGKPPKIEGLELELELVDRTAPTDASAGRLISSVSIVAGLDEMGNYCQ